MGSNYFTPCFYEVVSAVPKEESLSRYHTGTKFRSYPSGIISDSFLYCVDVGCSEVIDSLSLLVENDHGQPANPQLSGQLLRNYSHGKWRESSEILVGYDIIGNNNDIVYRSWSELQPYLRLWFVRVSQWWLVNIQAYFRLWFVHFS